MESIYCQVPLIIFLSLFTHFCSVANAQIPPTLPQKQNYTGLHAAALIGDTDQIAVLTRRGADVNGTDAYGRTPLHVATFQGHHRAMKALVAAGADPNALESDRYDIVTIAAVEADTKTLALALSLGASAANITSPYDGTALIAAAHLGHVEIVQMLIRAGAPLNHVNSLGWTAVIESIILGDGGTRYVDTLQVLIKAGADLNLGDRNGQTPLSLAQERSYDEMARILIDAGAE